MTDVERHKAHLLDPTIPDCRDSVHQHRLASEKQMKMIERICIKNHLKIPANLTNLTHNEASDFISYHLNGAGVDEGLKWWNDG